MYCKGPCQHKYFELCSRTTSSSLAREDCDHILLGFVDLGDAMRRLRRKNNFCWSWSTKKPPHRVQQVLIQYIKNARPALHNVKRKGKQIAFDFWCTSLNQRTGGAHNLLEIGVVPCGSFCRDCASFSRAGWGLTTSNSDTHSGQVSALIRSKKSWSRPSWEIPPILVDCSHDISGHRPNEQDPTQKIENTKRRYGLL